MTYISVQKLKDHVHISPNGVVFVKHHVRRGILTTLEKYSILSQNRLLKSVLFFFSRMLEEILTTRIMVKSSMKKHKKNKVGRKIHNKKSVLNCILP